MGRNPRIKAAFPLASHKQWNDTALGDKPGPRLQKQLLRKGEGGPITCTLLLLHLRLSSHPSETLVCIHRALLCWAGEPSTALSRHRLVCVSLCAPIPLIDVLEYASTIHQTTAAAQNAGCNRVIHACSPQFVSLDLVHFSLIGFQNTFVSLD